MTGVTGKYKETTAVQVIVVNVVTLHQQTRVEEPADVPDFVVYAFNNKNVYKALMEFTTVNFRYGSTQLPQVETMRAAWLDFLQKDATGQVWKTNG